MTTVTDSSSESNPRKKRKKDKEARKVKARAEVARQAQVRKEQKQEAIQAKKKAAASPTRQRETSASTTTNNNNGNGVVQGFCDICQMSEKFKKKHMTLLECKDCKVNVHDLCYGTNDKMRNKPNPNFRCWACQAVGHTYKVRERDPFSGEHLAVEQKERPRECCLCSVDDGNHALHPMYDAHGKKGRQILLPAEGKKPRRLAWAHTLCALTVSQSNETAGAIFGCAPDGFYDDDDEEASILSNAELNEDLDIDGRPSGLHHFVYWGYLHLFSGNEPDAWAKSMIRAKKSLRCQMCGKNDKQMVTLPGGQQVFKSLRVPVQCSANNGNENILFKKHHNMPADETCTIPMHVGCALWGRNDEGEYFRQRRSWFFPGFSGEGIKADERNPVVEVFCPCHAEDLIGTSDLKEAANMGKIHDGPFIPLSEGAQERLDNMNNKKKKAKGGKDPTGEFVSHAGNSSQARIPNVARGAAAAGTASHGAKAVPRPKAFPAPSAAKKNPPALAAAMAKKSPTAPVMRSVSLHGETKKKRAKELKKAGEAVQVQTKKQGRLVAKTSAAQPFGEEDTSAEFAYRDKVQLVFRELIKQEEECKEKGKPFDRSRRVKVRLQMLKKLNVPQEEFSKIWNSANRALKIGQLGMKCGKSRTGTIEDRSAKSHCDVRGEQGEGDQEDDVIVAEQDQKAVNPRQADASLESLPKQVDTPGEAYKDSQSREKQSTDSSDDPHAEHVNTAVKGILDALKAKGQCKENEDTQVVRTILKVWRSHLKKNCDLSTADYKIAWLKVAAKLEAGSWLVITSKPSGGSKESTVEASESQDLADEDHSKEPAAPVAALAVQESENIKDPPNDPEDAASSERRSEGSADGGTGYESNDHESSEDDEAHDEASSKDHGAESNDFPSVDSVLQHAEAASIPKHQSRGPWSYLHYGPFYRKEGFQFDKWDTYEEIDHISLSDDGDDNHDDDSVQPNPKRRRTQATA